MGRKLLREGEAAWRTVALARMPKSLSWKGFCYKMGWCGSCPMHVRTGDDHRLAFYLRAAMALGIPPAEFVTAVLAEMHERAILETDQEA